jgi:hypothetical protein
MFRAGEKLYPDHFLQILDRLTEGRLRHMQSCGGAREVQFFGDGNELVEQAAGNHGEIRKILKTTNSILDESYQLSDTAVHRNPINASRRFLHLSQGSGKRSEQRRTSMTCSSVNQQCIEPEIRP